MKVLLVTDREDLPRLVEGAFPPHMLEVVHYWHPVKAMDNLEEVDPDLVIFNAEDFPRHWKTFTSFLKATLPAPVPVVLLVGDSFSEEESAKATTLGVRALLSSNLEEREERLRLRQIITRYGEFREQRRHGRYVPTPGEPVRFIFTHPGRNRLVFGSVEDISEQGMRFKPEAPHLVSDLKQGQLLSTCSLRIGDRIHTLSCTVASRDDSLHLVFTEATEDFFLDVKRYIETHTASRL
ncbi:PilZ domain-containing protein [Spirochaeta thermophila]|uniref:PilZ domain-containing protein n=1 Tax=Winmispira thermophila (strain ATCC 49972 / DSM 6192 / RI 19.B1) TaxID=665571 RepID=E0RSX0_WINT6|nr:PilZ domain-containing protein [Spirochaeta thermophila]ADN02107.1 hypothetical protein STHERM_c11650 [Spirochaeta thermophila DSM 6192]